MPQRWLVVVTVVLVGVAAGRSCPGPGHTLALYTACWERRAERSTDYCAGLAAAEAECAAAARQETRGTGGGNNIENGSVSSFSSD